MFIKDEFRLLVGTIIFQLAVICLAGSVETIESVKQTDHVHTDEIQYDGRKLRTPIWTYDCINGLCQKTLVQNSTGTQNITTLDVCKLLCGSPPGSLWPLPTGEAVIDGPVVPIDGKTIEIDIKGQTNQPINPKTTKLYDRLLANFKYSISRKNGGHASTPDEKLLNVTISALVYSPNEVSFNLTTDESYSVMLTKGENNQLEVQIAAGTFFGARHALETLDQLIVFDQYRKHLVMPSTISIKDKPAYPYRGISLDTSRNFISVDAIKRTLDGMAANKLNVLHWHITDTHSFPFESPSEPLFSAYGAYSPEKVYKPSDIKEIVDYARVRGVKIVPEFDAPAHVGEGWQWTPPETVLCLNEQPWNKYCVEPPCGQLNPTKDYLYDSILSKLYKDMSKIFEVDSLFHMGGDEVLFQCWNQTSQITEWMKAKGWKVEEEDFLKLWDYFQTRAYETLSSSLPEKKAPDVILWTSKLTTGKPLEQYLKKDKYIIQIWTTGADPQVLELLNKGYRVIFSNYDALYLDCGFGGWVTGGNNWCSPYKPWQTIYNNDPSVVVPNITEQAKNLILGQSVGVWTEQIDDQSIDGRLWPRAAAMAERTWSNLPTSWEMAEYRMLHQRERLVRLGIAAEALQPQWCNQNEGSCPVPP